MDETVPTGDTQDVALDRMKRAGNFASNCAFIGQHGEISVDQIRVYISAARSMLDGAERTLNAMSVR